MKTIRAFTGMFLAATMAFTACNNVEDEVFNPGPEPGGAVTSYFQDFNNVVANANINLEGWTLKSVKGDRNWQGNSFDDNGYAQATAHNGTAAEYEYWMISPAFNVKEATQKTVSFKASQQYWQNTTTFEVYAMKSTDVAGEKRQITTANLPVESSPSATFIPSGDVDLSTDGDEIYIGFRYVALGGASNSTTIRIDDFSFAGATGNDGPVGDGDGTKAKPFSVSQAVGAQGQTQKWVEGYIVGAVNTVDGNNTWAFDKGTFITPSNVVIAQSLTETDPTKMIHVQLVAGTDIRNIINLVNNENRAYHKKVAILGDLSAYFGRPGLRTASEFTLEGYTPPTVDAIFTETFATGLGQFVGHSVKGAQVWGHSTQHGALMTGYVAPTDYENEDWLVSPEINLAGLTESNVSFDQAYNFGSPELISLWVTDSYTSGIVPSEWTKLEFNKPTGDNWTVISSGKADLTSYAGKKIRIALRYESITKAGTWQVKNFIVGKVKGDIVSGATTVAFTSTPVTSVVIGAVYNYNVIAAIGNGSGATTISATGLPAWATLTDNGNGTATIQGTAPEVTEVSNITLTASNNGVSRTQTYTLTVTLPVDPTDNLVVNHSFETWTTEAKPLGWDGAFTTGTVTPSALYAQEGTQSLKQLSEESTRNVRQNVPVVGGKTYRISYWFLDNDPAARTRMWGSWAKGEDAATEITSAAGSASLLYFRPDAYSSDSPSWVEHTAVLTAPSDATFIRLEVRTYRQAVGTSGGFIYFDNFKVEEVQ